MFVDRKRASAESERVPPGATVELYPPRRADEPIAILAVHDGLVFAGKPAGLATEPDHAGADCLVARVERLLGAEPGGLHALSRLDVGVSGVVTLARDAVARALVEELRATTRFARRYVAIASAPPACRRCGREAGHDSLCDRRGRGAWPDAERGASGVPRARSGHGAHPSAARSRCVGGRGAGRRPQLRRPPPHRPRERPRRSLHSACAPRALGRARARERTAPRGSDAARRLHTPLGRARRPGRRRRDGQRHRALTSSW